MKTCKRKYLKEEKQWEYKATDQNGEVYYYVLKPKMVGNEWCYDNTTYPWVSYSRKVATTYKNWRKSLRKIVD